MSARRRFWSRGEAVTPKYRSVIGARSPPFEDFSSFDQERVHHFAATCPKEEIKVRNYLPRISLRFTVLAEVADELMQSFV